MPWFLNTTRFVSLTTTINAPPDDVLKILQNPHAFFSLSPLISNVSNDPLDPSSYTVTDSLSFLGYFHTTTTFQCTLINRDNGVETRVVAGGGTRTRNIYRVKPGDLNGTSIVTEQGTVEVCLFRDQSVRRSIGIAGSVFPHAIYCSYNDASAHHDTDGSRGQNRKDT